jgi:Glycosyl transferase family 90
MMPLNKAYFFVRVQFDLRRAMMRDGVTGGGIVLKIDPQNTNPMRVVMEKSGRSKFLITCSQSDLRLTTRLVRRRLDGMLYWLSKMEGDVPTLAIDVSDGSNMADADFTWSSSRPDAALLPDPYFHGSRGFEKMRHLSQVNPLKWQERSGLIRWRGGANGNGTLAFGENDGGRPEVKQRIRLVLISNAIPETDVRLVAHTSKHSRDVIAPNCLGASISETSWLADKYAIDIDGVTNTWSNFLIRMHFGCCVLKIDSPTAHRQWYYDRIRPWEHFVPVKADMSDLAEKIDWVRSNDPEAEAIGLQGQAFARSMTFESETDWAVNVIRKRIVRR